MRNLDSQAMCVFLPLSHGDYPSDEERHPFQRTVVVLMKNWLTLAAWIDSS